MSKKYIRKIPSNEYSGSIALIYSEIKTSLLRKVKRLSINIDRFSCEDIIHDAFVDLLKRESLSIESSVSDAIKKYLTFKSKLNAKSFLKPRYNKEYSKTIMHLNFMGLDNQNINAETVNDKIVSEERLEVQKIKQHLSSKEWNVLELYFYHNVSLREIGKRIGCSYVTVRNKLKNIISKIQKFISTDGVSTPSVNKLKYQSVSRLATSRQHNLQYAV